MSRILPRFDFRVEIAAESVTGKVREHNEDALLVAPELALFGVADGMGGLPSGELASRFALDAARDHLATKEAGRVLDEYVADPTIERRRNVFDLLRATCNRAHTRLLEEQAKRGCQMGTTLDLCLFVREKAFVAHVGDGRVFLARRSATLQITEDHLVHGPKSQKRPDDAGRGRTPRPLASGIGLLIPLRVDVFPVDVKRGDTVLLASDGAYGPFESEAAITAACKGTPRAIAADIVRHSLARGGRDNTSVIVVSIGDRFVSRPGERPDAALDTASLALSPLFEDLPAASVMAALSFGIEIEIDEGAEVPPVDAGDLCAYIVMDGLVDLGGKVLGAPALLFAESLAGVERVDRPAAVVSSRLRCLRVRCDDFRELCEHDPALGHALYKRLATHLARTR